MKYGIALTKVYDSSLMHTCHSHENIAAIQSTADAHIQVLSLVIWFMQFQMEF